MNVLSQQWSSTAGIRGVNIVVFSGEGRNGIHPLVNVLRLPGAELILKEGCVVLDLLQCG